ncbi:MAG: fatty acid desaturase [Cyanobacteria bacterium P01_D01_bin.56]
MFLVYCVSMALLVAVTVISSWATSLTISFRSTALQDASLLAVALAIPIQTFLHTGLFITGHEAMHGNLSANWRINVAIGYLCLWLYGGLDYQELLDNHRRHHRYPATEKDPDFCHSTSHVFLAWYFSFMQQYLSGKQIKRFFLWLLIVACSLFFFDIPLATLFQFVLIPLIFSSLQLFTFGIYLPHRPSTEYSDIHRANSNNLPPLLSLIACYHFGYHWEHHQYPNVPWYRLPTLKSEVRTMVQSRTLKSIRKEGFAP